MQCNMSCKRRIYIYTHRYTHMYVFLYMFWKSSSNGRQIGFARAFCDIHCVRDAVIRGDRSIIRSSATVTIQKSTGGASKRAIKSYLTLWRSIVGGLFIPGNMMVPYSGYSYSLRNLKVSHHDVGSCLSLSIVQMGFHAVNYVMAAPKALQPSDCSEGSCHYSGQ